MRFIGGIDDDTLRRAYECLQELAYVGLSETPALKNSDVNTAGATSSPSGTLHTMAPHEMDLLDGSTHLDSALPHQAVLQSVLVGLAELLFEQDPDAHLQGGAVDALWVWADTGLLGTARIDLGAFRETIPEDFSARGTLLGTISELEYVLTST
jgi:hypothetical protein